MNEQKYRDFIIEIANCPFGKDCDSACKVFIDYQAKEWKNNNIKPWDIHNCFQIAEAPSGKLDTAKLIILSSNPGFAESDIFPTQNWKDKDKIDFFYNRFEKYGKIEDGKCYRKDSKRDYVEVPYWSYEKSNAEYLFGKGQKPILGKDYILAEMVYCKSSNTSLYKLDKVGKICMDKFFKKFIDLCPNVKVIYIPGPTAAQYFLSYFNIDIKNSSIVINKSYKTERKKLRNPKFWVIHGAVIYGRNFDIITGYHNSYLSRFNLKDDIKLEYALPEDDPDLKKIRSLLKN